MRVKVIVSLALLAFLVSAPLVSASLVKLTFPAVGPASASGGGVEEVMGLIGDVVKFSRGTPSTGFPNVTGPLRSIPAPDAFMSLLAPQARPDQVARDNIYKTLVGTNLTYYSIAGMPMNYTITADDIKSIDRTTYRGELAWRVRVGEGIAWDVIMDKAGTKMLDKKQLFQT